jgi:hypothetical protein
MAEKKNHNSLVIMKGKKNTSIEEFHQVKVLFRVESELYLFKSWAECQVPSLCFLRKKSSQKRFQFLSICYIIVSNLK